MKGYFNTLPYIDYDGTEMKDIFRRVIPSKDFSDEFDFYEYIVQDGDTPEILAYDVYGDVNRHWIILMINDIIDPYTEWVMSTNELERYTESEYGDLNGFHHYEDANGDVVYDDRVNEPVLYNLVYVTNIDHETTQNEKKRSVKLLPMSSVSAFEKMFEEVI